MIVHVSEEDVLVAIPRLTRTRLMAYVEAEVVVPVTSEAGLRFRQADLARMELLCDLAEGFAMDEDALGVVLSLIDQLHAARSDLRVLAEAVASEPPEVRARIAAALQGHAG